MIGLDWTSPRNGEVWRVVEAQSRASTLKLVDSADKQKTLERLIEQSKPPVPTECAGLHFLLFTPFRYEERNGSRFRPVGPGNGVFYAAETLGAAIAEITFRRLLTFNDTPGTPWPVKALDFTAFLVGYAVERCLDLTAPPLSGDAEIWTHPTDYGPTQSLAIDARAIGVDAIRNRSARDPQGGATVTLLRCRAFANKEPPANRQQTWRIRFSAAGVSAICQSTRQSMDFDRAAFARDPRIRAMVWERPRNLI